MGIFDLGGAIIGTVVKGALQPIEDGLDILDGLSEGEIRTMAIARLGVDVVEGMVLSEIIEALSEIDS